MGEQGAGGGVEAIRELNAAIDAGDVERFERALGAVADVDAVDESNWRALKRAIHVESPGFLVRLLERGADPNAAPIGVDEATAILAAVYKGRADLVEPLLRYGARAGEVRARGNEPLGTACVMNRADLVRMLLDAGAPVDGGGGKTPLMYAGQRANPEIVRMLLDRGADVKRVDGEGRTALSWAAAGGAYDCAPVTVIKMRPGMSAEERKKAMELPPPPSEEELKRHEGKIYEVVKMLLDAGADLNAVDKEKKPALGRVKCVGVARLLIERGARVDLRDKRGEGVRDWLRLGGIKGEELGVELPPDEEKSAGTKRRTKG